MHVSHETLQTLLLKEDQYERLLPCAVSYIGSSQLPPYPLVHDTWEDVIRLCEPAYYFTVERHE